LDPALASVLSALERVLAEEVYDPKSWAEEDEEEEDITAALARTHPEAARLYAAGAIDANVVGGAFGRRRRRRKTSSAARTRPRARGARAFKRSEARASRSVRCARQDPERQDPECKDPRRG
jgi:hypothetical protein